MKKPCMLSVVLLFCLFSLTVAGCAGMLVPSKHGQAGQAGQALLRGESAEPAEGQAGKKGEKKKKSEEKAKKEAEEKAKKEAEEASKASHAVRIREYLRAADAALFNVLQKPEKVTITVQTAKKEGAEVRSCSAIGKVYERGGSVEKCKSYEFQIFDKQGGQTTLAKKLYNQALDMDPNNIQALVGIANVDLILAMNKQYEVEEIRLEIEEALIDLKPQAHVDNDPLSLSYTELLDTARVKRTPSLYEQRQIVELLWEGSNNRQLVADYLRSARARCNDALRVNGQYASAHLGLAIAAAVEKNWEEAKAKLDFIEKNKLDVPRKRSIFHIWKGFVLERLGDPDGALKAYSMAIEFDEPYPFMDFPRTRVAAIMLGKKPWVAEKEKRFVFRLSPVISKVDFKKAQPKPGWMKKDPSWGVGGSLLFSTSEGFASFASSVTAVREGFGGFVLPVQIGLRFNLNGISFLSRAVPRFNLALDGGLNWVPVLHDKQKTSEILANVGVGYGFEITYDVSNSFALGAGIGISEIWNLGNGYDFSGLSFNVLTLTYRPGP